MSLLVCSRNQSIFHYSEKEEKKLSGSSKMAGVAIIANQVFAGHGHLEHTGPGWNRGHAVRYHTYIIPEGADLKDAIAFKCGPSLGGESTLSGTDERKEPGDVKDASKRTVPIAVVIMSCVSHIGF